MPTIAAHITLIHPSSTSVLGMAHKEWSSSLVPTTKTMLADPVWKDGCEIDSVELVPAEELYTVKLVDHVVSDPSRIEDEKKLYRDHGWTIA